jgi:hypothetical protein
MIPSSLWHYVGDVFDCGDTVYTITSGTVKSVEHITEAANGNTSVTGTSTPVGVVASDGTSTFRIVGAVWFGASFNVNTNTGPATFTAKWQIIGAGGKADQCQRHLPCQPQRRRERVRLRDLEF